MKNKYQDYPEGVQRASIIAAHSEGSEQRTVFRQLTDDEIKALEKELAETAVTLNAHDEILRAAKVQHKADTGPLKEQYGYVLNKIRAKGEEKVMNVHKYFNHDDQTVEYYDDKGVFIESRAMMPSEKRAILGETSPVVRPLNGTTD